MIRQTIGIACIALIAGGDVAPSSLRDSTRGRLRSAPGASAVLRARSKATRTTYPLPAGYSAWWFSDPGCPDSPDSFAYYVEWWNEDESFAYDQYAGHSSYYCGSTFVPQTLDGSSVYQYCVANSPPQWNCQLLYETWQTHP
jgi:hypothetical protein